MQILYIPTIQIIFTVENTIGVHITPACGDMYIQYSHV